MVAANPRWMVSLAALLAAGCTLDVPEGVDRENAQEAVRKEMDSRMGCWFETYWSDKCILNEAGSAPDAGSVPDVCAGLAEGASCGGQGKCESGYCVQVAAQGHKMVYVPAGSFWMGCNETKDKSCGSDEKPQHEVVLSSYWIDMYEVTVSDWGKCKAAGKCNDPKGTSSNCNWGKSGREQHPINCVAWSQARGYCQWLGGDYDLPTEAQWEKAARGGCEHNGGASGCKSGMRTYPWGEASPSCDLAVFSSGGGDGCGQDSTWAVGSKPKGVSPYGAHDMSGNVWEWVLDWYDKDYYGKLPKNDPVNNQSASDRVIRGGSWNGTAAGLRAGNRAGGDPGDYGYDTGFRCAR